MINLEFTQQQVDELKNYYKIELDKILNRANEIKEIIAKFEINQDNVNITPVIDEKLEIIPKIEKEKKNIAKKIVAEKKETWSNIILELLNKRNRPLSVQEIYTTIVNELKIPNQDLKKVYNNIEQNIFKLRKIDNKIESIKKDGVKEKLYGLLEWKNKPIIQNRVIIEKKEKENTLTKLSEKTNPIRIQNKELPVISYKEWTDLIIGLLNKEQKLLQTKDILPVAIKYYNVSDSKKKEIRNRLSPILTRLIRDNKAKTIQLDKINGRSYGLNEWFNENGELKPNYRIETIDKNQNNNKEKSNEKKTKQKRGKSIWPTFILDTIKEYNKILKAKNIVDLAMSKFKLPIEKYDEIRVLLATNISNLENNKGLIKSMKLKGDRANYYGMTEWFDESGKIKITYAKTDE